MNIRKWIKTLNNMLVVVMIFGLFASIGILNISDVKAQNASTEAHTLKFIEVPMLANTVSSNPIIVYFGQSDSEVIVQLPDLNLEVVASMDESQLLPKLDFKNPLSIQNQPVYKFPEDIYVPDGLLLYSDGYYGDKLASLSSQMGLNLDGQQLQAVEAISATKGVNTRYLLTLAKLKNADREFGEYQNWLKWLYIEASWVRSSLFVANDEKQVIQFVSGESVVIQDEDLDTVYRTIFTSVSAGRTKQQAETLTNQFFETYKTYFGGLLDEALVKPQVNSAAPFLYKPYNVALQGRGYYDHTYPSVDNGGTPNVGGMLDYLGRTNTNYDTHDGDDFWIPLGSQVIAPQGGQVVYMYDGGAGNKGMILYYGADTSYEIVIWHLNSVSVSLWQWVSVGQLLGTSGYAGGVNHIHFEVRHGGKQTDTMGWYGGGSDPCPGGSGATGNYKGCEASSWLWADENPPDFTGPTIIITQQPITNQWYNTDQSIVWTISDAGSGVRGYKYAWDQNPPSGTEIPGASNSILLSSGGQGTHTLYIQAWDNSGNASDVVSVGPFKYDTLIPSGSLSIQNGSPQTYSTTVELNTQASDVASGVSVVRFRDVGGTWSAWFPYPGAALWQLIGSHGQTVSVESQFKDNAGNVSAVYSDSIMINLYPVRPFSSLYVLQSSTFGAAGMQVNSSQYVLNGTAGQPTIIGQMESSNYRMNSGYWAMIEAPSETTTYYLYLPLIRR